VIDNTGEVAVGIFLIRFMSLFKANVVRVVGKEPSLPHATIEHIVSELSVPEHRKIKVFPAYTCIYRYQRIRPGASDDLPVVGCDLTVVIGIYVSHITELGPLAFNGDRNAL